MSAIDIAQVLFSSEFKITDKIYVRHSTVGDVVRLGEEHYFQILQTLTAIPSDEKYLLWQNGIDWMEISDLEFFSMMVKTLSVEESQVFLPGIDFKKFELYKRPDGDIVFADKRQSIVMDAYSHKRMLDTLCQIHRIKKKVEKAGNATTKRILIEEDRDKKKLAASQHKEYKSTLMPLISSMVNRSGFKYDYETIRDLRFGQFMDSVARLQLIVATDQLVTGVYAGNVDTKKLDKKKLDWTREI